MSFFDRFRYACIFIIALFATQSVQAGSFIFAGSSNVNGITHASGYGGSGGTTVVRLCVTQGSSFESQMELSAANIVRTINALVATTGNVLLSGSNNIPSGNIDFESVALHEVGHCLGLGHVNLATESDLLGSNREYTKSTAGADDIFNINSGTDGVIGSADDVRGDDINLHWFNALNNPFELVTPVDKNSYFRDVSNLPVGHNFAANPSRDVSVALSYPLSEGIMQQGSFSDEDQRQLTADEVATLLYAMSGLDSTDGTADDYDMTMTYVGVRPSGSADCDVTLNFDNSRTNFASCSVGGSGLSGDDLVITSASANFNTGYNWFFNDISNAPTFSCSGTNVTVSDHVFDTNDNCVATSSFETSGTVTVQSGVTVNITSPSVSLLPGFSAQTGSVMVIGQGS